MGNVERKRSRSTLRSLTSPSLTFPSLAGYIRGQDQGMMDAANLKSAGGMTGARVVHKKALRTSGTSPRDKSPPLGDGPALCRSQTKVKRKKKGKLPCERVKKTFYLGKRTSLEG